MIQVIIQTEHRWHSDMDKIRGDVYELVFKMQKTQRPRKIVNTATKGDHFFWKLHSYKQEVYLGAKGEPTITTNTNLPHQNNRNLP